MEWPFPSCKFIIFDIYLLDEKNDDFVCLSWLEELTFQHEFVRGEVFGKTK